MNKKFIEVRDKELAKELKSYGFKEIKRDADSVFFINNGTMPMNFSEKNSGKFILTNTLTI